MRSKTTKHFDMQIQTAEHAAWHEFNEHSKSKSPVKISKFCSDKSSLCMAPDVQLSQVDKLDFERKTLLQTLNLSLLNSVFYGQLISIKEKLINFTANSMFYGQLISIKAKLINFTANSVFYGQLISIKAKLKNFTAVNKSSTIKSGLLKKIRSWSPWPSGSFCLPD